MIMFLVKLLLELLVVQQVKFNTGKQALVFLEYLLKKIL